MKPDRRHAHSLPPGVELAPQPLVCPGRWVYPSKRSRAWLKEGEMNAERSARGQTVGHRLASKQVSGVGRRCRP